MKNVVSKKLISILILVCMLLTPVSAFAAEDEGTQAEPAEVATEPVQETDVEPVEETPAESEVTAESVQESPAESEAVAETETPVEPETPAVEAETTIADAVEPEVPAAPVTEAEPEANAIDAQTAEPETVELPAGMALTGSTLTIAAGYSFTTDQIDETISGLETVVSAIENRGTITAGDAAIALPVLNYQGSAITGGTFDGVVSGYIKITGGVFNAELNNPLGRISGGTFHATIDTGSNTLVISGGEFHGTVTGRNLVISGGEFKEDSVVTIVSVGGISGGTFYGDVDCRYSLLHGGTFCGTVENRSGVFYEDDANDLIFDPSATIHNHADGKINAGTYPCKVINDGEIYGGTFNGELINNGTIYDGVFEKPITNNGVILGGTFNDSAVNKSRILGGTFNGVTTNYSVILGGTFIALEDQGREVSLPDGLSISETGSAVVLAKGYSFTTDALTAAAQDFDVTGVENHGTITAGSSPLDLNVVNVDNAAIESGTFNGVISGYVNITGGTFNGKLNEVYGFIGGGTFNDEVYTKEYSLQIEGGTFQQKVYGRNIVTGGGTFYGAVDFSTVGGASGGEFYGTVFLRNGILMGGTFHADVTSYGSIGAQEGMTLTLDPDITITNYGTLNAADYPCAVINYGTIKDGDYTGDVTNYGIIEGGTFSKNVTNTESGIIGGGQFNGGVNGDENYVVLPESFDVSADGATLIVRTGYSVTTDDILAVMGRIAVKSVENYGAIAAGDSAINLPLTNSGTITGVTFEAAVTNGSKGQIAGSTFNGTVTNSGSISGSTLNGEINVRNGGRVTEATYGEGASVGENNGTIEVYYYTTVNGVTGDRQKAAYGANVLATLPKPAAHSYWYNRENTVAQTDTFGLETSTFVQMKEGAPVISWDSVTASAITYGQTLSASKLTYDSAEGTFAWKEPNTVATVDGGKAGYTVVFTPSAASLANYDYTGVALEATVKVAVAPRTVNLRLYGSTKYYGNPDPKLWGSYDGTLANDTFSFTVGREPGEDVGTYQLIANYEVSSNYTVNVIPATLTIKKLNVTITPNSVSKTWGEKDPELTATVSAIPAGLDPVDYTLQRTPGEGVGAYTISVVAGNNPNYQISAAKTGILTITAKSLDQVVIGEIGPQSFTGTAIEPAVTVMDGDTVLASGADYTVSYQNDTWPGTATITVTGKGNYQGTKTASFTIAAPVSSWQTVGDQRYYFDEDGELATGLATVSGSVYYFDGGAAQTGWQTISGSKYYFNTSGVMQTGWQTISGSKYYFNTSGVMQTGWQTISGSKY